MLDLGLRGEEALKTFFSQEAALSREIDFAWRDGCDTLAVSTVDKGEQTFDFALRLHRVGKDLELLLAWLESDARAGERLAELDQRAEFEQSADQEPNAVDTYSENAFDVDHLARAKARSPQSPPIDADAKPPRDRDRPMDDQAESWRRLRRSFQEYITAENDHLVAQYESMDGSWRFEGSPESERAFRALAREAGFRLTNETDLEAVNHWLNALSRNIVAPVGPDSTTDPSTDGTLSRLTGPMPTAIDKLFSRSALFCQEWATEISMRMRFFEQCEANPEEQSQAYDGDKDLTGSTFELEAATPSGSGPSGGISAPAAQPDSQTEKCGPEGPCPNGGDTSQEIAEGAMEDPAGRDPLLARSSTSNRRALSPALS